jgi:CHAT domain-containing protein
MNLQLLPGLTVFTDGTSADMRGAASAVEVVSWAWRAAGVPTLVLPRWSTDERSAKTILQRFYTTVVMGGESPEYGLRAAASAIRSAEETRAPYYWAAWQVVGR